MSNPGPAPSEARSFKFLLVGLVVLCAATLAQAQWVTIKLLSHNAGL